MGLPVVVVDDRTVLQIQSHPERTQPGLARPDRARAGASDGAIRPSPCQRQHRTRWLHLAVCRERSVLAAAAARHRHGAAAAARTESVGRWADVSRRIAVRVLNGERYGW